MFTNIFQLWFLILFCLSYFAKIFFFNFLDTCFLQKPFTANFTFVGQFIIHFVNKTSNFATYLAHFPAFAPLLVHFDTFLPPNGFDI